MPQKTCLAQLDSPIVLIQPLEYPKMGLVSEDNTVYVYDISSDEATKIFHPTLSQNGTLYCAFDPHHSRLLLGSDKSHILTLIDLQEKKVINQFDLGQQSPTIITFSPDGLYCLCGTDQGRVLLWRFDSSTLISRLHSFPEYSTLHSKPKTNYVSALTFDGLTLASSGYGGSIVETDYRTQHFLKRYSPSYVKNTALLLYNRSLISGNQEGTLIKIDRNGKLPNQRLRTTHKNIRFLLRVGAEPYIIVASNLPYITLINGNTFKIIHERYIEFNAPLASLCVDDNHLYVSLQNREFLRFDLQPFEHLEKLITLKNYKAAYHYCVSEPLLLHSEHYQRLETIYTEHINKAKEYLSKKKLEESKRLLEPFITVKPKEIAEVFRAYSFVDRLTTLYEQNKLSAFYGHTEQYPLLKETPIYRHVEKIWAEKFTKAQKLMLLKKHKEIHEELRLFSTVSSKRPFILLLIQNPDVLINYSKFIQTKNYTQLKILTQRFPLLRKLPSYIKLIEETGEMTEAFMEALQERSLDKAELFLNELQEATPYESEYFELKKFHSLAKNLDHSLSHNHLRIAYRLIDTHHELLLLSWGEKLNTLWNEKLIRAERYAMKGDISSIKKEFNNLINIPQRHARLGDIFRMGYHVQLKILLKKDPETFSLGVLAYCEIFGMDTELRNLLKKAKQKNIVPELSQVHLMQKSRDQWLAHISILPNKIA